MPFARPTLAELITRIRADMRGRLELSGSLLRRAMVDVLASAWAGAVHMLHGHLDWASRQIFVLDAERTQLLRITRLYGITPTPATYATGSVDVTGTDGSTVLAGRILRLNTAISYVVTTGATIAGGVGTVVVSAVLAGADSNLIAGAPLSFESPIAGVASAAVVASGGLIGGVDEEGTEELRDRLLLRIRQPPAGGAIQDYEAWALAAAGVERAWVYPLEYGLGTVIVRVPDAGTVVATQAALEAERPITAYVQAIAAVAAPVAFTISITPDTTDIRTAVAAELTDLFDRVAEPGDGAGRGTVLLSQLRTAVGVAAGVVDYTLTVPSADVVPDLGELPTLGTITWA